MVRTRHTNKTKRYTEFAYELDDDDEDASTPTAGRGGDALSDFEAAPDEDELSAAEDYVSEADDDPGDLSDQGVHDGTPKTQRSRSKRVEPSITPATSPKHGVDYHELPPYPLDSRIPTRAYTGPLKRGVRSGILRDLMYGPEYSKVKLIWDLYERWYKYAVLPPRHPPKHREGVLPSPWVPPGFELEQEKLAAKWFDQYFLTAAEKSASRPLLQKHGEQLIPRAQAYLNVLLGPVDSQKEIVFSTGTGTALSETGLPIGDSDSPDSSPNGWIVDVGGIVVALGWAPILRGNKQILALAVVPHSDQAPSSGDSTTTTASGDERRPGSIQFWEYTWDRGQEGRSRSSLTPPRFLLAQCFDWGRPKRMEWCPVSFGMTDLYGTLAVLCDDGRVRVLEVKTVHYSGTTAYEFIDTPIATLGFTDNYNVEVTSFTWVGCNRIALGHTDGSITLWSIYPTQILQRHAPHSSHVLDIRSGYPSMPHMIASVPVGGFISLTDLSNPTGESTYVAAPGIQFQPGLLDWSDHLQGWLVMAPAGLNLNTVVFVSVRYFPLARSMLTTMSAPMCVSIGGNHPYGLVGCADGSIWSFNALSKVFRERDEDAFKIKIFEHEFRPADASQLSNVMEADSVSGNNLRGASRLLQGFLPEVNDDPRATRMRELNRKKVQTTKKKAAPKGKKKGKAVQTDGADEDDIDVGDDLAIGGAGDVGAHMAARMVTHEPLTRVSATAWNPNVEFATWVAVALGSGLVRVMDLGVE